MMGETETDAMLAELERLTAENERLRAQLAEALDGRERPFGFELLRHGGEWLGIARSWMQHAARNGERVTWGSGDALEGVFTVQQIESLVADVAASAMATQPTEKRMGLALKAQWMAEGEVERLTRDLTAARAEAAEARRVAIQDAARVASNRLTNADLALAVDVTRAIRALASAPAGEKGGGGG